MTSRALRRYRWALVGVVVLVAAAIAAFELHPPGTSALSGGGDLLIPTSQRVAVPQLTGITNWVNTPPLTFSALRGRVVLVDFWTFSCINCVRTLPYLHSLYDRYRADGLVVLGVHTPEFDFEKVPANVAGAVKRLDVTWPVAEDPNMATWNAFGNEYWPAQYIIDRQGRVAAVHVGEGDDDLVDRVVVNLLGGGATMPAATPAPAPLDNSRTDELYAGSERSPGLAAGEQFGGLGTRVTYPDHGQPQESGAIELTGSWIDQGQYIESASAGHVRLRFSAYDIEMVAAPVGDPVQVTVTLDGTDPPASERGSSLGAGGVTVPRSDLYDLLRLPRDSDTHVIDISVPAGFQLFTFTFG